jgi:hypothetical protein
VQDRPIPHTQQLIKVHEQHPTPAARTTANDHTLQDNPPYAGPHANTDTSTLVTLTTPKTVANINEQGLALHARAMGTIQAAGLQEPAKAVGTQSHSSDCCKHTCRYLATTAATAKTQVYFVKQAAVPSAATTCIITLLWKHVCNTA